MQMRLNLRLSADAWQSSHQSAAAFRPSVSTYGGCSSIASTSTNLRSRQTSYVIRIQAKLERCAEDDTAQTCIDPISQESEEKTELEKRMK